VAQLNSANFP